MGVHMISLNKLPLTLLVAWPIVWVPVSFLFQQNPHLPISGLFSPIMGFFLVIDNSWEWEAMVLRR